LFDERPSEPITPEQQQISEELMTSMRAKISEALEADSVKVVDVFGDHQHVSIEVVSSKFEDKTTVQRQRMVYQVPVQ
jgi:stress-induced morphogen